MVELKDAINTGIFLSNIKRAMPGKLFVAADVIVYGEIRIG